MKPLVLLLFAAAAQAQVHAPTCTQPNVSVSFDDVDGRFNGKTESGGLLVIRNFGDQSCAILPKPAFRFEDKDGKPIDFTWAAPRFMHPGPVMRPILIPPGAEVSGHMQWIYNSSDRSIPCARTAILEVKLDGQNGPRIRFEHDVCGKTFTLEPLHTDPIASAAPAAAK